MPVNLFAQLVNPRISNDPIRFVIRSNKPSVVVGEPVELTITAQLLNLSPTLMFFPPGSNGYTLKLLSPEGFQITSSDFSEFVTDELTYPSRTEITYRLQGHFVSDAETNCFRLLRAPKQSNSQTLFEEKASLCVDTRVNRTKSARSGADSAATQADLINGCSTFTAVCSGNQYEVRTQTITIATAGVYALSLRYMVPEKAVKAIIRIDGKSQTVRFDPTKDYQTTTVGSYTLTAGVHTIGLSSGVDEGYICFDQLCAKPTIPDAPCKAPAAPVISSPDGTQVCNGSSLSLTASGCSSTVAWSNGATGSSISVKTAGVYSASCVVGSCSSVASNIISVTACVPVSPPTPVTPPTPTTASVCNTFTAVCSGNQYEVRTQTITIATVGVYALSLRYMVPEKAVRAIIRIDGASQTVRFDPTKDYQTTTVGSYTLTAGVHTIGLSSGVDEGYICFDQICAKPTTPDAPCTAPAAPVISSPDGTQVCNGSSLSLTASGCSGGTINWSNGAMGSSISVKTVGVYSTSCVVGSCSSVASNVISVTACVPVSPPTPVTPPTPTTASVCNTFTAACSGNQYEVRTQTITIATAGVYALSLRYMVPEKAVKAIIRIDGKSQTVRFDPTKDYQTTTVGSYTLTAGVHTIGLSSGVDEGYICFDQLCAKPTTPDAPCTAPAAPVISSPDGTQVCNGSSLSLTASGCSGGTINWSNGATGSSIRVKTAGAYSASCVVGSCSSVASNIISVTACVPVSPPTPVTPPTPTTASVCNTFTAVCSGNQYEVRTQTITIATAGVYALSLRYMVPEKAVRAIIRIDGASQTVRFDPTKDYQTTTVGSYTLTAGVHTIGLSSGVDEGYICFDQLCAKPTTPDAPCTAPAAPVISSPDGTQVCNGSSLSLTASGCSGGTINWSNGSTGSSMSVKTAGAYTASCVVGSCSSIASNVISVTACVPVSPPTPVTPPSASSVCNTFTAACSGNQYEVRTQTITIATTGVYALSLRYMVPEKAVRAIIRIDGASQTVRFDLTKDYQTTTVGSYTLTAGVHTIGLSSGVDEGYICFDQICAKPTTDVGCTPPQVPVISSPDGTQVCNGSSVNLTASGCSGGTINWSNGATGSSISVKTAGAYTASCLVGSCSSVASNAISITSCDLPKCTFTPTASASNVNLTCGASVNLVAGCNGVDCDGVNYSWNGQGVAQYGQTASVNAPNSNGSFTYTVTASKLGCVAKKDSVILTVTGCAQPSTGVYSYRGDTFDYNPLGDSPTSDVFPVFENDKIKVKLALRNQTLQSQEPGMGGAVYQIFNKQHNATHTLVFNPNRYNGDDHSVVDRSGTPNRIGLGGGLSECLYALPKPFYSNEFDGAAGSSYPVNGANPGGYDGGLGFNPNEVGDDFMNSGQLLKFGRTASGFYTKTRPPIYGQNRLFVGDQVIFEKWGSLDDRALDLHYQSTFNRTSYTGRSVTKSQENPCLYVNGLRIVKYYDGNRPYSNDGVTTINQAVSSSNQNGVGTNGIRPNGLYLSEPWIWIGGDDGYGIGLLIKDNIKAGYGFFGDGGFIPNNPGPGGSYGYIGAAAQEILDNRLIWRHTSKVIVGTVDEVRAYVYSQSYRPDRTPKVKFNRPGREGWSLNSGDGDERYIWDDAFDGGARPGWKLYFDNSANAVVHSPGVCWETSQFNKFYIRYKYSGNQTQWSLKFQRNRQKNNGTVDLSGGNRFAAEDAIRYANGTSDVADQTIFFSVIPDNQWHVAVIDLSGNGAWQGVINNISIKPHPFNGRSYNSGEYGTIDWINSENKDPFPD